MCNLFTEHGHHCSDFNFYPGKQINSRPVRQMSKKTSPTFPTDHHSRPDLFSHGEDELRNRWLGLLKYRINGLAISNPVLIRRQLRFSWKADVNTKTATRRPLLPSTSQKTFAMSSQCEM